MPASCPVAEKQEVLPGRTSWPPASMLTDSSFLSSLRSQGSAAVSPEQAPGEQLLLAAFLLGRVDLKLVEEGSEAVAQQELSSQSLSEDSGAATLRLTVKYSSFMYAGLQQRKRPLEYLN